MTLSLLNLTPALAAESARAKRRQRRRQSAARGRQPGAHGQRMYGAAQLSRLTSDWRGSSNTSEDAELSSSLRVVRSRSRQLVRDNSYAQRAKNIIQNNVVGSGIGMQPRVMTSRGQANERVNDQIFEAWDAWCRSESCHVGAALHFCDLERMLIGQVFEAGEIFCRKFFSPLGGSEIPLALEVVETERIADEYQPSPPDPANMIRLGVEVNRFYRPVAYWIRLRHPGEIGLPVGEDRLERVPAEMVYHLRVVERWPQTRAIPWLHAAARRLHDMDGYSEAEIVAARGAAAYMGVIKSPAQVGETNPETGKREWTIEPGILEHLQPGEEMIWNNPNRPNANLDPFMRMLLREIAAGVGVSYESLSRDYSQSNYSSSRLALLDDRDLWRVLQMWFIRSFRAPLHRIWLQQAILAGALPAISIEEYAQNPAKFEAVQFRPRGWGWVDPAKEVAAYKEAIRANLTSKQRVVAAYSDGAEIWEILEEREQERQWEKEKGVPTDTDGVEPKALTAAPTPPDESEEEDGMENAGRGAGLVSARPN